LLDPLSVRKLAEYKDDQSVLDAIKQRVGRILAHSEAKCYTLDGLSYEESEGKWLDDEFDEHIWIADQDEVISPGLLTPFPVRSLEVAAWRLNIPHLEVVSRSPEEQKEINPSTDVFRLDIIDVALYRTLLKHPELMRTLDCRTFEKLLADVLESLEYEVELQRGTKDGGVDIFALKKDTAFGIQLYLVQAKRWSNKVGIEPVRQLVFLQSHYHVTKACLATTATFTRGAWELAEQYRWQLELRDFNGLQEWIGLAARKRGMTGQH
jgi:HJR/Mrr/RecB family endonuclease